MGVFKSLKEAIFGKDEDEKKAAPAPSVKVKPPRAGQAAPGRTSPQTSPRTGGPPQPRAVSEVDVEKKLDSMQGADKLNWRSSIVDLMKLIGIDSSFEYRKELAQEMGRSDYSGSAEDNMWLHKRVMTELAKAGGKVPTSLRD